MGYLGGSTCTRQCRHALAIGRGLSRPIDLSRLLAEILGRFGHEMAWGSSTRGGAAALRKVVRRMRDGYDASFTPDGPRGPRRRVQPGVIAAARLSSHPIQPRAFSARPARRLRTWDRTLLPYPFSRGLYLYGDPFPVPRDADAAEQERLRLECCALADPRAEQQLHGLAVVTLARLGQRDADQLQVERRLLLMAPVEKHREHDLA